MPIWWKHRRLELFGIRRRKRPIVTYKQEESGAAEPHKIGDMGGVRSTGDWGGKDLKTTTAHLRRDDHPRQLRNRYPQNRCYECWALRDRCPECSPVF